MRLDGSTTYLSDNVNLQEFVEATKENSGLDMGKLGEQPGNRDPTALGEAKTPQGQDVSGTCTFQLAIRIDCGSFLLLAHCA